MNERAVRADSIHMPFASSHPLITTVIPTYRRPALLARAIRSVLAQTYPHFRVCVYDNASGDGTAAVVEEFVRTDSRVQYHRRDENIGLCRNFAEAAAHINTPFFSFLSDDDILLPPFYETALANFERFPETMMSAMACVNVSDEGVVLKVPMLNWRPGLYLPPQGMLSILKNGHPDWTGVLFRQDLLREIGLPDVTLGPPFDLDFELRAAARFPMAVSLQPGALFVIHKDSAGILEGFDGLCPGWYKMICKITSDETIPAHVRTQAAHLLSSAAGKMLLRSSLSLIAKGDWKTANQAILYLSSYCRVAPSILKLLLATCRRFGLFRRLLFGLLATFRLLFGSSKMPRENKQLQRQFGNFARCLEL
jgi:glycosyltransferase involved in cell wall biosynthesis